MNLWRQVSDVCDVSDHHGRDELCDRPQRVPEDPQHPHNDRQSPKGEHEATHPLFSVEYPISSSTVTSPHQCVCHWVTLWPAVPPRSSSTSCLDCWGCRCSPGHQTTTTPWQRETAKLRLQTWTMCSGFRADAAAPWPSSSRRRNTWWKQLGPNSCLPDSKKETDWWSQY